MTRAADDFSGTKPTCTTNSGCRGYFKDRQLAAEDYLMQARSLSIYTEGLAHGTVDAEDSFEAQLEEAIRISGNAIDSFDLDRDWGASDHRDSYYGQLVRVANEIRDKAKNLENGIKLKK